MSALATLAFSGGVGFAGVDFDAPHVIQQDGGQGPPESR
jgi:hypothetical protein